MPIRTLLVALVLNFGLLIAPVYGQSASAPGSNAAAIAEISPEMMKSILHDMGFDYIDDSTSQADLIRFQIDGYRVALLNRATRLIFFSGFSGGDSARNRAWNEAHQNAPVSVDKAGTFVLETDLDLVRGVTRDDVEAFIRRLPATLRAYAALLGKPIAVDVDTTIIAEKQQKLNAEGAAKGFSLDWLPPKDQEVFETAQRQIEQMDKAIEGLTKLKKLKDQQEVEKAGYQALQAKHFDVAVDYFTRANEIDSGSAPIWALLGQALLGQTDSQSGAAREQTVGRALDAYQKAIALKPDDAVLRNGYGFALARAKKPDEAQAELTKAAQLDPSNAGKYYFTMGAAYVNSGRNEDALSSFKKAADAGYPEAYYQMGVLLIAKATIGADRKVTPVPGTVEAFQQYLRLVPSGQNVGRACTSLFLMNAAPAAFCQNKISLPGQPTATPANGFQSQPGTNTMSIGSTQQASERSKLSGPETGTSVIHERGQSATTRIRALSGDFAIWIDPNKWRQMASPRSDWLQFQHTIGAGVGRVVTEARRLSTPEVLQVALSNLQSIDRNVRITLQEDRAVNGHHVIALRADGEMDRVPVTFYSYLFGGTSGNIQVLTITPASGFPQNADDLTKFLDGIDIPDQKPDAASTSWDALTTGISAVATVTAPSCRKNPSATTRIKTPFGDFAIWIDTSKWRQVPSNAPGTLEFNAVNGEGFAKVITEKLTVRTEALPDIALAMARTADPNMRISLREKRVVNGHELIALQLEGTVKSIPVKYFGYYYGGTSGTIQVATFTTASAFDRNAEEFTTFLDGIEISDQPLPPSAPSLTTSSDTSRGTLTFNGDTMQIIYDERRWRQVPNSQPGRFQLAHTNGDAYAMVIAERLSVPVDALPDVALANARSQDPDARITFRERRNVAGVDVWFLKIEAAPKSIPFSFYGYYYSGESGTAQVIAYTGRNLISEYGRDFEDLLNGLRIIRR
jgi:tetratricopeptide (TPR) repeat protein